MYTRIHCFLDSFSNRPLQSIGKSSLCLIQQVLISYLFYIYKTASLNFLMLSSENLPSSDMSSAFSQCQYVCLHQCVRDVLRARKLRSEQENPLFPIYENVNPEYHRGRSLLHFFISLFSKIQSIWKPLKTSSFPNTH